MSLAPHVELMSSLDTPALLDPSPEDGVTTVVVTLQDPTLTDKKHGSHVAEGENLGGAFFAGEELKNSGDEDTWDAVLYAFEVHYLTADVEPTKMAYDGVCLPEHMGEQVNTIPDCMPVGTLAEVDSIVDSQSLDFCESQQISAATVHDLPFHLTALPEVSDFDTVRLMEQNHINAMRFESGNDAFSDLTRDGHEKHPPGSPNVSSHHSEPGNTATPDSAADLVRIHAARALRSLIFGRDDGRGRRRIATDGDRVSLKKSKRKGKGNLKRLESQTADDTFFASFDETSKLDSDLAQDTTTLAALYLVNDPQRWRDSETTETTMRSVETMTRKVLNEVKSFGADGSRAISKINTLSTDFSTELTQLSALEQKLVQGVHGALIKWGGSGGGGGGSSPGPDASASQDSDVFSTENSRATEATKNAACLRFRECRFRILGTLEKDLGVAVSGCRDVAGNNMRLNTHTEQHGTKLAGEIPSPSHTQSPKRQKQTTQGALSYLEKMSHGFSGGDIKPELQGTLFDVVPVPNSFPGLNINSVTTSSPKKIPNKKPKKPSGRHSKHAKKILEAWLCENFYPTPDRQKPVPTKVERQQLAQQTGLTERQVQDWFVNARARVWKPEMKALLWEME